MAGIFSICLSSEMFQVRSSDSKTCITSYIFQLTNEERISIAKRVAEKAAGRVPVVAGGECSYISYYCIHANCYSNI